MTDAVRGPRAGEQRKAESFVFAANANSVMESFPEEATNVLPPDKVGSGPAVEMVSTNTEAEVARLVRGSRAELGLL